MKKRPTFKHGRMKLEKYSPVSCYLTIDHTVFYIEISSATEYKPLIESWHKWSWSDPDDVTQYEPKKRSKRVKK
jgi:hypothetical protein